MLILTRKQQEIIWIGEDVQIKVIRTSPTTVKLGIEAPAGVRILRGELRKDPTSQCGSEAPQAISHEYLKTERPTFVSDQFPHPYVA